MLISFFHFILSLSNAITLLSKIFSFHLSTHFRNNFSYCPEIYSQLYLSRTLFSCSFLYIYLSQTDLNDPLFLSSRQDSPLLFDQYIAPSSATSRLNPTFNSKLLCARQSFQKTWISSSHFMTMKNIHMHFPEFSLTFLSHILYPQI